MDMPEDLITCDVCAISLRSLMHCHECPLSLYCLSGSLRTAERPVYLCNTCGLTTVVMTWQGPTLVLACEKRRAEDVGREYERIYVHKTTLRRTIEAELCVMFDITLIRPRGACCDYIKDAWPDVRWLDAE